MSARMVGVDALLDSIADTKARWAQRVEYEVGSNVDYAIHIEFGTSKMRAQPYLRPATERTRRQLDAIARKADSLEELVKLAALSVEQIAKDIVPVDTGRLRSSITTTRVT